MFETTNQGLGKQDLPNNNGPTNRASQVQVLFPRSSTSPEVFGHGEGRKKHGDLSRMGSRVAQGILPGKITCLQEDFYVDLL